MLLLNILENVKNPDEIKPPHVNFYHYLIF